MILHTFQQNSSCLRYLLFPCVKYCNIARSRLRNIAIDEILQSIIFKHHLHPILLGYVIRAPLKGILQYQPIERHFNEYSTVAPRNFCSKFELSTSTKLSTASSSQSPMIKIASIPCRNLLILIVLLDSPDLTN